jgi:hypothetical protein
MNRWRQTRHFPDRILWRAEVGTAVFTLRLSCVEGRAVALLRRLDNGGAVPDRRDGWTTSEPAVEGLDAHRGFALRWADERLVALGVVARASSTG